MTYAWDDDSTQNAHIKQMRDDRQKAYMEKHRDDKAYKRFKHMPDYRMQTRRVVREEKCVRTPKNIS